MRDSLLNQLLTAAEVAEKLHLSLGTLAGWRCEGKGPKYVKAGRVVLYPALFVEEWLQSNVQGGYIATPAVPVAPLPVSKPTKATRRHRFGGVKTKRMRVQEALEREAHPTREGL